MLKIDDLEKNELNGLIVSMNNDMEEMLKDFTIKKKWVPWEILLRNNLNHIERLRKLRKKFLR